MPVVYGGMSLRNYDGMPKSEPVNGTFYHGFIGGKLVVTYSGEDGDENGRPIEVTTAVGPYGYYQHEHMQ